MSFNELNIKQEYRTLQDDIIQNFYLPILNESISYKRSVGFFSSSGLIKISKGICELAKNGGTIDLVASPNLSAEDLKAIEVGYENRTKIIENALLRSLNDSLKNPFDSERLNLLANLIERGILNIKIAFTENDHSVGIYHEKLGLVEDAIGNKIAFTGSMNETGTGMNGNYESVDVFCSWRSDDEKSRVIQKEEAFSRIWGNYDNELKVLSFPVVDKAILEKYKTKTANFELDKTEFAKYSTNHNNSCINDSVLISKPNSKISEMTYNMLYPYQKEAIAAWVNNNCCGIYDMATGMK